MNDLVEKVAGRTRAEVKDFTEVGTAEVARKYRTVRMTAKEMSKDLIKWVVVFNMIPFSSKR